MNEKVADQMPAPFTAHASPVVLAKASLGALGVAGAALVLFVLPAEAGVDPTGVGSALGLTGMGTQEADGEPSKVVTDEVSVPSRASIEAAMPWREDSQTIELAPHSGIEVKAHMKKGDSFLFDWKATGGPVKVDMHGEPPNAADGEFTSYWIEPETTFQAGTFVAPIDGSHGWYWRNKGDKPVTINLKVSGFYKDLYRP